MLEQTVFETLNNTGAAEHGRYMSYKLFAENYNSLLEDCVKDKLFFWSYNLFNISEIPTPFNTPWLMQKSLMESVLINVRMLKSNVINLRKMSNRVNTS